MPSTKSGVLNTRKPFKLLVHFTDEELRQFRNFLLHPPLETSGKYAQKILEVFDRCQEVNIFERQVGKSEFVAGTKLPSSANAFDKLISAFYDRMQGFLAFSELKKSPGTLEQLALRGYQDRDMEWKEIHRRFNEAQRELNKLPQSSQLGNLRWAVDLDMAVQTNARSVPPEDRSYSALLTSLEVNYALQKLRLLCAIANEGKIFANQVSDITSNVELPVLSEDWSSLTQMYYYGFSVLSGKESDAAIDKLLALLNALDGTDSTYPLDDMKDLYGYVLNALIYKVNQGDANALEQLSRVHDLLIDQKIVLTEGLISAEQFKNIISVKLKNGEYAAARKHFDAFADRVSHDPGGDAARYNSALLLYAEQRLVEAAEELENMCSQIGNIKLDEFYGLDIRSTLLRVYFDLLQNEQTDASLWDETDEKIVRLLDAYKSYIARRKIAEQRRKNYEAFRKLMQLAYAVAFGKETPTPVDFSALEDAVHNSNFSIKSWFEKRMEKVSVHRHRK